ncbi:MAG TPA: hypothetical protein VMT64_11710 [Candidatus Binataceae bacterium]|nr:hypothetical protein [Candidatus Binataceae bacterium]
MKIGMRMTAGLIGLAFGFVLSAAPAHAAAKKVDCDAVMQELNSGKKTRVVAVDQKISTSSVYRCKKRAATAAKAAAKAGNVVAAKPAASPATAKP